MTVRRTMLAICLGALLVRAYLGLNLPLTFLPGAHYDDGLFMKEAINLVRGLWLGPFNQFTLAKGPGYPLFLALGGISGISISVLHNVFDLGAITVTAILLGRLLNSASAAFLIFLVLMLDPSGISAEARRVIRDQIYWGQTLLVFSMASYALMAVTKPPDASLRWSIGGGLLLAWAWLTREEGVWYLPGLVLLAAGAVYLNRKQRRSRLTLFRNLAILITAFAIGNAGFMLGNKIAYGTFEGVDFTDSNFQDALSALESIKVGEPVPFVPVSNQVIAAAEKISPTFSPMAELLLPTGAVGKAFDVPGCHFYPWTCGQIAGGWFSWAFRDAAAAEGYYSSPAVAADAFRRIADEISSACAAGTLTCRARPIAIIPNISIEQLEAIPTSLRKLISIMSLFTELSYVGGPSPMIGNHSKFYKLWAFLGYPYITQISGGTSEYTVSGWYANASSEGKPSFTLDSEGTRSPMAIDFTPAPDVSASLGVPIATVGRFSATVYCQTNCAITVTGAFGDSIVVKLAPERSKSYQAGKLTIHIDNLAATGRANLLFPERQVPALMIARWIGTVMSVVKPVVLGTGFLAFVLCWPLLLFRRRADAIALTLATAAWTMVASRIALLALIDVSSFPATSLLYTLPISYLSWIAAIASLWALREASPWKLRGARVAVAEIDSV